MEEFPLLNDLINSKPPVVRKIRHEISNCICVDEACSSGQLDEEVGIAGGYNLGVRRETLVQ